MANDGASFSLVGREGVPSDAVWAEVTPPGGPSPTRKQLFRQRPARQTWSYPSQAMERRRGVGASTVSSTSSGDNSAHSNSRPWNLRAWEERLFR